MHGPIEQLKKSDAFQRAQGSIIHTVDYLRVFARVPRTELKIDTWNDGTGHWHNGVPH
jgi:hypothetical protein